MFPGGSLWRRVERHRQGKWGLTPWDGGFLFQNDIARRNGGKAWGKYLNRTNKEKRRMGGGHKLPKPPSIKQTPILQSLLSWKDKAAVILLSPRRLPVLPVSLRLWEWSLLGRPVDDHQHTQQALLFALSISSLDSWKMSWSFAGEDAQGLCFLLFSEIEILFHHHFWSLFCFCVYVCDHDGVRHLCTQHMDGGQRTPSSVSLQAPFASCLRPNGWVIRGRASWGSSPAHYLGWSTLGEDAGFASQ